jgi:hypothetical protein
MTAIEPRPTLRFQSRPPDHGADPDHGWVIRIFFNAHLSPRAVITISDCKEIECGWRVQFQ